MVIACKETRQEIEKSLSYGNMFRKLPLAHYHCHDFHPKESQQKKKSYLNLFHQPGIQHTNNNNYYV